MQPYPGPPWTDSHQIWTVDVFYHAPPFHSIQNAEMQKNKRVFFFCDVIASVLYKQKMYKVQIILLLQVENFQKHPYIRSKFTGPVCLCQKCSYTVKVIIQLIYSFLITGLYFFFNMLTAVIYNEFRGYLLVSTTTPRSRVGFLPTES